MNAALRKEIRLLMPMWILALAIGVLPVWIFGVRAVGEAITWMQQFHQNYLRADIKFGFLNNGFFYSQIQSTENLCLVFFIAGALLLSLASFGNEMSFGTFSSLLAQPRPRLETWQRKIGLLAAALASVVAASGFSWWLWVQAMVTRMPPAWTERTNMALWFWPEHLQFTILLTIVAFGSGLWTTLLFRQTMAAFWFAVLIPWMLFYFCSPLLLEMGDNAEAMLSLAFMSVGYALTGFFVARWLFFRAEDKPEREATDVLTWSFLPVFQARRRPLAALLVKELRLQQGTLVIAVAMVFLHLAAVAAQVYLPPALAAKYYWLQGIWMVWFVAPLLVACASVAEERRGRTLEGALCLPVAGPRQFAMKLLIVFGLGIFLGAFMPWLLELTRPDAGMNSAPIKDMGLPRLLLTAGILTSIGCYGSSLCNTLLQAFGAALFLGVLLLASFNWTRGIGWLLWPVLTLVSVYLSYANFKQLRITGRQLARNGNIWLLAVFATMVLWGAMAFWTGNDVFDK